MYRKDLGIDVRVIQAGFSWLTLEGTGSPGERKDALDQVNELLQLVVTALFPIEDEDDGQRATLPDDFDRWVFGIVAESTVLCVDDENSSKLWKPILSLGTPGKEWVEQFYWDWFTDGLQAAPSADAFVNRWVQMVEFALDSPLWDPKQVDEFELEKPIGELLGLEFGLQSIAADPRGCSVIGGMAAIYPRIVERWFCLPDVVNGFCSALAMPAYDILLCRGIRWLNDAMTELNEYRFWRGHGIEENLISALYRCWENHRDAVRDDQHLQAAFLALLMALESRGNHAAMALRELVVDSIPDAY